MTLQQDILLMERETPNKKVSPADHKMHDISRLESETKVQDIAITDQEFTHGEMYDEPIQRKAVYEKKSSIIREGLYKFYRAIGRSFGLYD